MEALLELLDVTADALAATWDQRVEAARSISSASSDPTALLAVAATGVKSLIQQDVRRTYLTVLKTDDFDTSGPGRIRAVASENPV